MQTWLPVLGYEGVYEVSISGLVRRSDGYHPVPRTLKPGKNHHGYLFVSLSRGGKMQTIFVHRLVAEAFIGPRPAGMTINHKNGDKEDNRASNLEFMSHADNMRHADTILNRITPTRARGERNGCATFPERLKRGVEIATAKLTDEKVRIVRSLLGQGVEQRTIAETVGISQTQIWRIKVGLSWAHVK
jgi:hypothetical protein